MLTSIMPNEHKRSYATRMCSRGMRQGKAANTLLQQFGFEAKPGAAADPQADVDWDAVVSPLSVRFMVSLTRAFVLRFS